MNAPTKAVFLSYASEDAAIAARLCESLSTAGIEVWFDQDALQGGEAWDRQIRNRINDCALFVPIISQATERRLEGYFRREWRLATERSLDMADNRAFILPVTIEAIDQQHAQVPEVFLKLQWTRLPGGQASDAFLRRIQELLQGSPTLAKTTLGAASSAGSTGMHKRELGARWVLIGAMTLIAVVVVAGLNYFRMSRTEFAGTSAEKSIAVLPFVDMSEIKGQEYFSDGMAEEILDMLVKVPELKVIARTSSFQFKGRAQDLRQIGQQLGAHFVVEGSVRRTADRVRITAQLISADDGAHVWSQTYERPVADVLTMQSEIALGIARELHISVGVDTWPRRRATNPVAYEQYLRGKLEADSWSREGWDRALAHFQAALALDPNFASAAAAEALVYASYIDYGYSDDTSSTATLARSLLHRALDNDPQLALAHALLGDIAAVTDYDWETARREMGIAMHMEPGNALVVALAGKLAVLQGDGQNAISLTNRAVELDPLLSGINQLQEYAYSCENRYAEAEEAIRRGLRLSPDLDSARFELGLLLIAQGKATEALAEVRQDSNENSRKLGIVMAMNAVGNHTEADKEFGAIKDLGESNEAVYHAARGDLDQAFTLLSSLAQRRANRDSANLPFIKCHIMYAPLRNDARYGDILRKMNLTP